MAEIVEILPEHRVLVEPHLRERLNEYWQSRMDEMFAEVVYTYPEGYPLVTLNPLGEFPAMQFSCITGDYCELTSWDYIQTVDTEEQQRQAEEQLYWELVASVIEYYHTLEFRATADYDRIARSRTVNSEATSEYGETIYEYNCPSQDIYLTAEHYPVTWGEQFVDSEQKWYMYNFNTAMSISDIVLEDDESTLSIYKIPYEWKREEVGDA